MRPNPAGTTTKADSLHQGAGLCCILGVKGRPVFIRHSPHSHLGLSLQPGKSAGTSGPSICFVLDLKRAHGVLLCPVLGSNWVWGKGYASPHPHSRANTIVWRFQAGRLGPCRSHTCCHSCLLLASSKFQTCQWWARAEAAIVASPRRTASVPETQWLCQEANPTVWVGTGVGLSILLPGEQLQCCGKSRI